MNTTHKRTHTKHILFFVLVMVGGCFAFSGKYSGWARLIAAAGSSSANTAALSAKATQTQPQPLSDTVKQQIAALTAEKQSRSSVQNKINSQLLFAIKMHRNEPIASGIQRLAVGIVVDNKERIEVDINTTSRGTLIEQIGRAGGEVVHIVANYHTIRAKIPAQKIEQIAALPEVKYIRPRIDPITSRIDIPERSDEIVGKRKALEVAPGFADRAERVRAALSAALPTLNTGKRAVSDLINPITSIAPLVGSKNSEGDATHRAANARSMLGVSGAGVKIGVLSDGALQLASAQASGDLGPVTVLPGQAGVSGDEGTAMLEIIHDLAPNAQLFFATAFYGAASFANNIRDLRAAGCEIIVDDVFYFDESPFQEGQAPNLLSTSNGAIIAQAVIDVTNSGALYFSAAGNEGSKVNNTSGVWEGDFVDGGLAGGIIAGAGTVHDFGGSTLFNTITLSANRAFLFWSDPLAGSANDYDLIILNGAGTSVIAASTDFQTGTQDPVEGVVATIANNSHAVIVKASGVGRYLNLNTIRGRLSISTNGQIWGHSAVPAAFSCAATPAATAISAPPNPMGPFPSPFTSMNKAELYSSDGPRRVFFNSTGTPFTPGNFSSTGGVVRQKPDITAADGVSVTGAGGFATTFYGTSAAAPHAGAIAALVKQAGPSLTPTQIRTILTSTAIDIEAGGYDSLSGFGIVDTLLAVQAVTPVAQALLALGTATATEGAISNGNGAVEPGELANIVAQITNPSIVNATNVQATLNLSAATPGVTIISGGPVSYGSIAAGGNASNMGNPFVISTSNTLPCGVTIPFSLTVSFGGGTSPVTFNFSTIIGTKHAPISTTLDVMAPPAGTGYTASTGTQTGRLLRNEVGSSCSTPKINPGLFAPTGVRRFDAYTFTNTTTITQCVIVILNSACGANLFTAAYNGAGFAPSNPSTNYLADPGVSNTSVSYSFNILTGQQFTVVVHEVDSGGGLSCAYTLDVGIYSCAAPVCPGITLNPATIPAATVNQPYSQTFTATGGLEPYSIALTGTLPVGMNFTSGVLSGTPTQNGDFPFAITATNALGCQLSRNYSLVVETNTVASTNSPASDQKPGSVLFYNLYTSSINTNQQNTRVSMTNTHQTRPAFVHLFFVDGSSCSVADSFICLTENQTTSYLISDIDPGTTGYIVAVASDVNGCPSNFNYLIGDEYVKFAAGHAANLTAESITAIAGSLPFCNTDSTSAVLAFDGISYNIVPRVLAVDNVSSRTDGNDTLLVLNRVGGNLGTGAATLTGIFGIFYDDGEAAVSFNFNPGTCQFRSSLTNNFPRITPRFEQFIPAGRSGWIRLFSQNDQGLFGAVININSNTTANENAFNHGHNLHKLTNMSNAVYTIPVFPPNC